MRHEDELIRLIVRDDRVMGLLVTVRSLDLADWCIAAGTIRNLVWDHLHGHQTPTLPSDVDVLFHDARMDAADEESLELRLTAIDDSVTWEVVNQATIHHYTGDETPYESIGDAMSRWADLVTAVGAFLTSDGRVEVVAPAGLDDLFGLRVRPNIMTPSAARVYEERMASKDWRSRWPKLTIEPISR